MIKNLNISEDETQLERVQTLWNGTFKLIYLNLGKQFADKYEISIACTNNVTKKSSNRIPMFLSKINPRDYNFWKSTDHGKCDSIKVLVWVNKFKE